MSKKWIDLISIGSLIVGLLAEFIGDWADEKSIDALIDEKLNERGIGSSNKK